MKTLVLIFGFVTLAFVYGCQNKPMDIDSMLENETTRDQVFEKIVNDQDLVTEFMAEMKENMEAMKMMGENKGMMMDMMGDKDHMMTMMKNNPEMMTNMMGNMIDMAEEDSTMCANMISMMGQKEHIMQQMEHHMKNMK